MQDSVVRSLFSPYRHGTSSSCCLTSTPHCCCYSFVGGACVCDCGASPPLQRKSTTTTSLAFHELMRLSPSFVCFFFCFFCCCFVFFFDPSVYGNSSLQAQLMTMTSKPDCEFSSSSCIIILSSEEEIHKSHTSSKFFLFPSATDTQIASSTKDFLFCFCSNVFVCVRGGVPHLKRQEKGKRRRYGGRDDDVPPAWTFGSPLWTTWQLSTGAVLNSVCTACRFFFLS